MSSSLFDQAARGIAVMEPLTTDQYHRMIETGILVEGTPVELIDGNLVRKDRRDSEQESIMNVGPGHASIVQRLQRCLDRLVESHGHHARGQLPIHIPPLQEPEPDVSVVRGDDRTYELEHPRPDDVVLVAEIADSSLRYDRGTKQRVYASARIPQYWIVNLQSRCVESYTQPKGDPESATYASRRDFSAGETVEFDIDGKSLPIEVNSILPA